MKNYNALNLQTLLQSTINFKQQSFSQMEEHQPKKKIIQSKPSLNNPIPIPIPSNIDLAT